MTRSVSTFLMFEGNAEDAMRTYEKVVRGPRSRRSSTETTARCSVAR